METYLHFPGCLHITVDESVAGFFFKEGNEISCVIYGCGFIG
jgi:hypothetical protein